MTRATLVYLHGFNSSAQSVKGRKIAAAAMASDDPPHVHLPTLHHEPSGAMREVCAWVDASGTDPAALTFVGSSLGGYYATWLAEKFAARAIVINPAVRPAASLRAHLGPQRNLHTGESWNLTPAHFVALDALAVGHPTRMERYFLLQRSGDELLDWREAVAHYAGAWQFVCGRRRSWMGGHRRRDPGDAALRRPVHAVKLQSRIIASSRSNTMSLVRRPLCSNSLVSHAFMPAIAAAVCSDGPRGTYMSSA